MIARSMPRPSPSRVACVQGRDDVQGGADTGEAVGPRDAGERGRATLLAREPERARDREVVHVVPGALAPGAVLAVARDGDVDEARVRRRQRRVVDPEARGGARAQSLEHDVGCGGHPPERRRAARVLQVERAVGRPLVERADGEATGDRGEARVRGRGTLDPRHVRAEVAERGQAVETRQRVAHRQHPDAVERGGRHGKPRTGRSASTQTAGVSGRNAPLQNLVAVRAGHHRAAAPLEAATSPFGRNP